MHILKYTDWQGPLGWFAGDVSDLANGSNYWWHSARMLKMSPADYVAFLLREFKPDYINYLKSSNVLMFYWKNYGDCKKFCSFINKEAKDRKFYV